MAKKGVNKISEYSSEKAHSKMRKAVAPMAAGIAFTMLSCQTPKEKSIDKKDVKQEQTSIPREYETDVDVDGNKLILKEILSVNDNYGFYKDSVSQNIMLYKIWATANEESRKEVDKGPYTKVENYGDYIKAIKDTVIFDLVSKNTGSILEGIEDIEDISVKGYKIVKRNGLYGLFREEVIDENGKEQKSELLTSTKYLDITPIRNSTFVGYKDKGYDVIDENGMVLGSVDRIFNDNPQVYIKDGKLLLFAKDGSKVQLDAYTIFDNGGEGSDGDIAIVYQGRRYYFDFMQSDKNGKNRFGDLRERMGSDGSSEDMANTLKILIDYRNLAGKGNGQFDMRNNSGYEDVDARLLKPNKSEKEIRTILQNILSSKDKQKRGDVAFEKIDVDGNYILSYKIIGWSGTQQKQMLQSGEDIKYSLLNKFQEYNNLGVGLFGNVFNGLGEEDIVDIEGNKISNDRMYKPDEKVYIKAKPIKE